MDKSREIEIKQRIDAYIKGQLEEDEIQELWNEFAKEPELLDLLELEVNLKALIERKTNASHIKKLPSWTWHAVAAAVLLIVALVQLFRVETPTALDQFVIQQINPSEMEYANGIRSENLSITTADSLLNLGFQAAISGDEERALELFNEVIDNFDEEPYGSKAFLNKGILLYNDSDYKSAILAFREAAERVESSRMITEKTYWYLGNALVNVGELEAAHEAVFQAYQINGVFRSPAFRLLKKLSNDLGISDYEDLNIPELD
ncbi:MAG TPA: tetratricopeptide repeat protein [Gracilimonas sp.]|uniref:tetratricopeptide repeat protein n=1 Tax=Gracilimonas sp. TaxID=1974203 RepID=UPI002D83C6AA|nr:tetratricopeptide repeat protein [Gracilimonas sp.]